MPLPGVPSDRVTTMLLLPESPQRTSTQTAPGVAVAVPCQSTTVIGVLPIDTVPGAVPNHEPLIFSRMPTGPEFRDKLLICGSGTVNGNPLLSAPFTETTTLPVTAPLGTVTSLPASLQREAVAATRLTPSPLEIRAL